jgi:hypothetical protein
MSQKRKSSNDDDDVIFVSSQPRSKAARPFRPYETPPPPTQAERNTWVVEDDADEVGQEILDLTQDSFDDVAYQGFELYGM